MARVADNCGPSDNGELELRDDKEYCCLVQVLNY